MYERPPSLVIKQEFSNVPNISRFKSVVDTNFAHVKQCWATTERLL